MDREGKKREGGAFQQHVNVRMREAYTTSQAVTRAQIELQVWQQMEEELFEISNLGD